MRYTKKIIQQLAEQDTRKTLQKVQQAKGKTVTGKPPTPINLSPEAALTLGTGVQQN